MSFGSFSLYNIYTVVISIHMIYIIIICIYIYIFSSVCFILASKPHGSAHTLRQVSVFSRLDRWVWKHWQIEELNRVDQIHGEKLLNDFWSCEQEKNFGAFLFYNGTFSFNPFLISRRSSQVAMRFWHVLDGCTPFDKRFGKRCTRLCSNDTPNRTYTWRISM